MEINLGNIYWLEIEKGIAHPHVVIDMNEIEATVVAITTNQNKTNMPGNVLLNAGEGNLEKDSIVEVGKVYQVNLAELIKFIGSVSHERVDEIKNGIGFLERSFLSRNLLI
ncbi:MAG: type II toxin-antitoxin system PemK/MazF family toxin [Candidatus Dojkabacteria bacterium]